MYRKSLSVLAGLLAVTALALTPGDSLARSRNGGGGGNRGGSGWSRGGGSWNRGGGWGGGYYGGRGWGWGGVGIGIGLGSPYYGGYGYGYSPYGGGYGYSDYYPSYSSSPYNYGGDDVYNSYPSTYDMGSSYSMPSSSGYTYGAPASDNNAIIRVTVPPDASVSFDDHMTQQRGSMRVFSTPALTPGKTFSYDVKATWRDANGKEITREKKVDVSANSRVEVDLTR
jgi:uncharacterized protein (TIGR03000 family)